MLRLANTVLIFFACCSHLHAQQTNASRDQILTAMANLASDTYKVRETAEKFLIANGADYVDEIEGLRKSDEVEVRYRAERILALLPESIKSIISRAMQEKSPLEALKTYAILFERGEQGKQLYIENWKELLRNKEYEQRTVADLLLTGVRFLHSKERPVAEADLLKLTSKLELETNENLAEALLKLGYPEVAFNIEIPVTAQEKMGDSFPAIKRGMQEYTGEPSCRHDRYHQLLAYHEQWELLANAMVRRLNPKSLGSYRCVLGLVSLFGEERVKQWLTDPIALAAYNNSKELKGCLLALAGKNREAEAALQAFEEWDPKGQLAMNNGNWKEVHIFFEADSRRRRYDEPTTQAKIAMCHLRNGNEVKYREHLKQARDAKFSDPMKQQKQIYRLLTLHDIEGAIDRSAAYQKNWGTFNLMCLSLDYERSCKFALGELGEKYKVKSEKSRTNLRKHAAIYFKRVNHQYAKTLDPNWQPPKLEKTVTINVETEISQAVKDGKRLSDLFLRELIAWDNRLLTTKYVDFLKRSSHEFTATERRFLDYTKEWAFLKGYYLERWKKNANEADSLFLAGHYAEILGENENAKTWKMASYVMPMSSNGKRIALLRVLEEKAPDSEMLRKLWSLVTKDITTGPSRGLYNMLLTKRRYKDAANVWLAAHVGVMMYNFSYSKQYWAWHNNCQYFEAKGLQAIAQDDLKLAEQHLQSYWKFSRERNLLGSQLYHAYQAKGDNENAERVFWQYWRSMQKLREQIPDSIWAHSLLVRWCAACRNGADGEGVKLAESLYEKRNKGYLESKFLAQIYVVEGESDKARRVIERWKTLKTDGLRQFTTNWILRPKSADEQTRYFGHLGSY